MNCCLVLILSITMTLAEKSGLEEYTIGQNLFTASLYREVAKENAGKNFLISSFSAQTILALTQSGAKGDTAAELRTSLHLPSTTERTEEAYRTLLDTFNQNQSYELSTANRIYVKAGLVLNPAFEKIALDVYKAGVQNVDFTQNVEAAKTINGWVEQQTHDKIRNLISSDSLDDLTRVILVNALYFKGKFATPFETYATVKQPFFTSLKESVDVDMMNNVDEYNYYESAELNAKFLELPYEGEGASLIIALPNARDGLAALEQQIEKVLEAPKFTRQSVKVSLPKFTVESKFELKDILIKLGVKKAFAVDADLSGIAGQPNDLYVSNVIQKTFINVTEEGTEAAAATAVLIALEMAYIPIEPQKTFLVDKPFLYYIQVGQLVIFQGRITSFS